jgi:hypothetical protein
MCRSFGSLVTRQLCRPDVGTIARAVDEPAMLGVPLLRDGEPIGAK